MAKVLDKTTLNGNMSKLIELPDEYIINGHIYDKSTFAPKPLQYYPVSVSTNEEMAMNEILYYGDWNRNRSMSCVMIDKNDPTVSYQIVQGIYIASQIIKTTRNGKSTVGVTYTGTTSYSMIEFISQDDLYIYITEHRNNITYVSRIHKDTMARDNDYNLGNPIRFNVLQDTNNYIYLSVTGTNNTYRIQKYNKTTGAGTIIFDDSGATANTTMGISTPMDGSGTFYIARDGYSLDSTKGNRIIFRKYILNTTNDVVTAQTMTMDLTNLSWGANIPITNNQGIEHETFLLNDNGNNYLCLFRYNNGANSVPLLAQYCSMYVFLITGATTLKLQQEINFAPLIFKGFMPMYSNKILLLSDPQRVHFYNWNSTTQMFENTSVITREIQEMGVDMNNNIWIQSKDSSLEIISNTMPIKIEADFPQNQYQFTGNPIVTSAIVFAENFLGQYLSANIQLQLIGPATFVANGLKTLTVTTSNLNTISVPVNINGAGFVKINTQVL